MSYCSFRRRTAPGRVAPLLASRIVALGRGRAIEPPLEGAGGPRWTRRRRRVRGDRADADPEKAGQERRRDNGPLVLSANACGYRVERNPLAEGEDEEQETYIEEITGSRAASGCQEPELQREGEKQNGARLAPQPLKNRTLVGPWMSKQPKAKARTKMAKRKTSSQLAVADGGRSVRIRLSIR